MAKSRNDILFRFLGDTKSLDKASRKARGDFKDTEKSAGKLTTGMQGVRTAFVAAGGAFAIKEVGQFLFDSARMAEQADIVAGSFDKIFEESAPQLRGALEDVRLQVGLNSLEFEQLLLKTGQLLVGFGSTGTEAAQFGDDLFTLAADLAAFQGDVGLTDDALHALNRALVGEFDPLEQFVGGVKASTVAAKALEMGLADTTAELTDQDKALALLEIVALNAEDAIGSLAEQEETLASRTLEASARLDDLQIMIGESVTPAMILAAENTLDFAKGLTFLADESVSTTSRLGEFGKALGEIWLWGWKVQLSINPLVLLFKGVGKAAEAAGTQLGKLFDALRKLASNPLSGINFNIPKLPSVRFPGFAQGGEVPGPEGQAQLAVVHGGEQIMNRQQQRQGSPGMGGGTVVNINFSGVVGDPAEVAQQIKDLLEFGDRVDGLG